MLSRARGKSTNVDRVSHAILAHVLNIVTHADSGHRYYEWLKKGKDRLPHFTKRGDGKLLLLAGLYDCVTLEGQTEPLYTFTIVTTEANKEFDWLHDRQPVILPTSEAVHLWLDTTNHKWDKTIVDLMNPYHDENVPLSWYGSRHMCFKVLT